MTTIDTGHAQDGDGGTAPARSFPRRHDELTTGWLSEALRSRGLDVTVRSFRRRPMAEGVGMMATIELVDIEYEDGGGPATLAVKLPAVNDANLAVAVMFDIYRREVLFYRDLAHLTPACTPEVFFAEVEGSSDFVLVLEDLSDYRLGDQLQGCSLDDARLALTELGKLHASFWGDVDRPELDFVPYETPSTHGHALRQGATMGWDVMVANFGDVVPEFIQAVKGRFLAAVPRMQQWLVTPPLTIVHGDFRMDNLLFGQEPGHEAVATIDWQGVLRAKGVRDVAYLLSQSVSTDDRRAHERDLIAHWHQTLVDGAVAGYSLDQAWEDYRRAVLAMWTVAVVIAGALDASNDRARAWMTEMIKRSTTTIGDLHLVDVLAEFEDDSSR